MNKALVSAYRCPISGEALALADNAKLNGDEIVSGTLNTPSGRSYPIIDGVPDLTYPPELEELQKTRDAYDLMAEEFYENALNWLFACFNADESEVREAMVDLLELEENHRVLETGSGTGRDTLSLMKRLPKGELFAQDLSSKMIRKGMEIIAKEPPTGCRTEFSIGNAEYLSFPDDYFDAYFHFGGVNEFAEKERAIQEMARVVKPGGKVVFGDESLAPWHRDTEYGKVLINNNHLMGHEIPLESLPQVAHDVSVRWILGNSFYLVKYTVGEEPPKADFDLPHKGRRGGTCRTRYYGQLEGVTLETKALAERAAERSGKSMHDWLDKIVREGAEKSLDKDE